MNRNTKRITYFKNTDSFEIVLDDGSDPTIIILTFDDYRAMYTALLIAE